MSFKGKVEKIPRRSIYFLGEKDGESEREIKNIWTKLLAKLDGVNEAYLPVISLNESREASPALCLYPYPKSEKEKKIVLHTLGEAFVKIFHGSQHLDMLFLSEEERKSCLKKCRPFYKKIPDFS